MTAEIEEAPTETGTSFGDAFGSVLDQIQTTDTEPKATELPIDKPEVTETVKPVEKPEEKKPVEAPNPDNQPTTKPEQKPESKESAKPTPAAQADKEKRKVANLDLETREFLLASEARKAELVESYKTRIKTLEEQLNPTKEELEKLRTVAAQLPEEKKQLEAEIAELRKTKDELSHKVTAYDVRESEEYREKVRTPWDARIIGDKELAVKNESGPGINGLQGFQHRQALLQIIQTGDEKGLEELLRTVDSERMKARINSIFDEGQELIRKDREYAAKGPEALKEINERKTRNEREKQERARTERNGYLGEVDAAATKAFSFLAGVEGDDALNNALKAAKERMAGFDFNKLSPGEQAFAAHQFHHAPIIMHVQGQRIGQLSKELEELKSSREEEIVKKDAEIAKLTERLGNIGGTRITPGAGKSRGDDGRFVGGENADFESLFNAQLKQAQRGN